MQAALKWVLQDENVHTTIPAFSNYDEMREDLSVMEDLTLSPQELRDLRLGEEFRLTGLFCQQCAQCLPQCPAGMDIPALMRSYMYAIGYRNPEKARNTLQAMTPADIRCSGCDHCPVRCALGHDIRTRALDIAQMLVLPGGDNGTQPPGAITGASPRFA
jgi:predicted aldo/keto reductase-like oxidoreductase